LRHRRRPLPDERNDKQPTHFPSFCPFDNVEASLEGHLADFSFWIWERAS
jgi:hypothetical protein